LFFSFFPVFPSNHSPPPPFVSLPRCPSHREVIEDPFSPSSRFCSPAIDWAFFLLAFSFFSPRRNTNVFRFCDAVRFFPSSFLGIEVSSIFFSFFFLSFTRYQHGPTPFFFNLHVRLLPQDCASFLQPPLSYHSVAPPNQISLAFSKGHSWARKPTPTLLLRLSRPSARLFSVPLNFLLAPHFITPPWSCGVFIFSPLRLPFKQRLHLFFLNFPVPLPSPSTGVKCGSLIFHLFFSRLSVI